MATLLPNGKQSFVDANGNPLAGGSVTFYVPGTSTYKNTWQDSGQTILNTNPITLDSAGRAIIYGSGAYRQVVKDVNGNTIWDQVTSDTASGSSSWGGTTAGTANAQTVTASNFTSTDGQSVDVIWGLTNTGGLTLNPNGTGPITVLKDTTAGAVACTGGEAVAGNLGRLVYSSVTGSFHLTSYPLDLSTPFSTIASAATTNLGSLATRNVLITGTTTITSFGSSASTSYPVYQLKFSGALTLTYNATSMILPGSVDITTAANDTAVAFYLGSGNWQIASYTKANATPLFYNLADGYFRNLSITVTSNTAATIAADLAVLGDSSNKTAIFRTISTSIATGTSGAGGLDTGALAANTWYAVWLIGKADGTVGALISTSATSPTLPSGYTFKARIGWVRYATGALARTLQYGNRVQYVVVSGSQTPNLPIMASGIVGNTTTPTWSAIAWANFAPSTVAAISVALGGPNIAGNYILAPNNSYGGSASTSNPAPVQSYGSNYSYPPVIKADIVPEGSNLYWASSAAQGFVLCCGWVDNL